MATATDNFAGSSGTFLDDHVADTGQAWTALAGFTDAAMLDGTGGVYTTSTCIYTLGFVPATPDYDVSGTVAQFNSNGFSRGLAGRVVDVNNCYFVLYQAGGWKLYSMVAGASTQLGGTYTTAAGPATLRLRGDQISVVIGGSPVIGPITNTDHATAGRGGLIFFEAPGSATATTGYHLQSFSIADAAGGGGPLSAGTLSRSATYSNGGTFTASSPGGGTGSVTIALRRAPVVAGVVGTYATVGTMTAGSPTTDASASPGTQYSYVATYTDSATPTPQVATSNAIGATTMALIAPTDPNVRVNGAGINWQPVAGGFRAYRSGGEMEFAVAGTHNINALFGPGFITGNPGPHIIKAITDKIATYPTIVPGVTRATLAAGSSSTSHGVYLAVELLNGGGWSNGQDYLDFLGLEVDPGATSAALGTAPGSTPVLFDRGADAVFAGDSITDSAHDGDTSSGTRTYCRAIAAGSGQNCLQLGSPGATTASAANVFGNHYAGGPSRLVAGKLKAASGRVPSALWLCYGRNDSSDAGAALAADLAAIRAMVDPTTEINFLVPFAHIAGYTPGVDVAAAMAADFGTTTAVAPGALILDSDPYAALIDLGAEGTDGLYNLSSGSLPPGGDYASADWVHPNTEKHALLGALALRQIQAIRRYRAGGGGTGSYTPAANVRSGADRGDGIVGTLVVPAASDVLAGVTFDNGTVGTYSAAGGGITLSQLNAALAAGVNVTSIAGSGPAATQLKLDELAPAPALPAVDGSGRVLLQPAQPGVTIPANVTSIAGSGPAATQLRDDELAPAPALPAVDGSGRVSLSATGLNAIRGFKGWNFAQMLRALTAVVIGKRSGVPTQGTAGTISFTETTPGDFGSITVDTAGNIATNSMTPPAS